MSEILRIVLALALVVGLMFGLAKLARRPLRTARGADRLEVLARRQLTRGASIALIRSGQRTLLLGVTDARVSVLADAGLAADPPRRSDAPLADASPADASPADASPALPPAAELPQPPTAELPALPAAAVPAQVRGSALSGSAPAGSALSGSAPAGSALSGSALSGQTWRQALAALRERSVRR
jgi:flagellar protein FliO/FliZ